MAGGRKRGGRGGGRIGTRAGRIREATEVVEPEAEVGDPAADVEEVDDTQLTIQEHLAADIAKKKKKAADLAKEEAGKVDMYGEYIISDPRDFTEAVCWAVAITEVVEAHYNIGRKGTQAEYLALSPQFLLNKVRWLNDGLRNFGKAAEILFSKGLPSESQVPYAVATSSQGHGSKTVRVLQHEDIDADNQDIDEDEVMRILNKGKGPVVLVFNVDETLNALPAEAIYNCPGVGRIFSHAVVVVGYGESNGQKYWHIRNCYGPDWCKKGYGKFSRGLKILKMWYPVEVK